MDLRFEFERFRVLSIMLMPMIIYNCEIMRTIVLVGEVGQFLSQFDVPAVPRYLEELRLEVEYLTEKLP